MNNTPDFGGLDTFESFPTTNAEAFGTPPPTPPRRRRSSGYSLTPTGSISGPVFKVLTAGGMLLFGTLVFSAVTYRAPRAALRTTKSAKAPKSATTALRAPKTTAKSTPKKPPAGTIAAGAREL